MDRELQFVEYKELGTVRDAHTFVFHAQVCHVLSGERHARIREGRPAGGLDAGLGHFGRAGGAGEEGGQQWGDQAGACQAVRHQAGDGKDLKAFTG